MSICFSDTRYKKLPHCVFLLNKDDTAYCRITISHCLLHVRTHMVKSGICLRTFISEQLPHDTLYVKKKKKKKNSQNSTIVIPTQ